MIHTGTVFSLKPVNKVAIMEKQHKKAIKKLIQVNLDAYAGYKDAAELSDDSLLKTFFNKCALDRKSYAENLARGLEKSEVDDIGTDLKADLHRMWIDLKTASQEFNSKTLLSECGRGEKHAIAVYEEVLQNEEYPPETKSAILFQKNDIISKYDQIKKLKDDFEDNDNLLNRQTPVP